VKLSRLRSSLSLVAAVSDGGIVILAGVFKASPPICAARSKFWVFFI
jgi:hypothetical protein